MAFTASIVSSLLIFSLGQTDKFSTKLVGWFLFWLSTAIKFLTLPLILPLWLIAGLGSKLGFKYQLAALILGFLLVWGGPLLMYRSSLSVSFVYNNARPIKYSSFPAHIIRVIDLFTHSEIQVQLAPDFQYQGPVSEVMTKVVKVVFPLSLLVVLIWASRWFINLTGLSFRPFKQARSLPAEQKFFYLLKVYALFIFTMFMTAKIFSQPFHVWYFPLIVLFPFMPGKWQRLAWGSLFLLVIMDTTTWLHLPISLIKEVGPQQAFRLICLRDVSRYLPMMLAFFCLAKTQLPKKYAINMK